MATASGNGWTGEWRRFLRDFVTYAGRKGLAAAGFVAANTVHFLYPLLRLPLWLWRRVSA